MQYHILAHSDENVVYTQVYNLSRLTVCSRAAVLRRVSQAHVCSVKMQM